VIEEFQERIRAAAQARAPLRLRGGGSKDFYGETATGEVLDTRGYAGIVDYQPTELYVTARCGTRLRELEDALADAGQMLAFEPPHYAEGATVGGMVAAGLSGPRRASAGALRDFVLGAQLIDGRGEVLRFGGQVMKNVAGYDVSRLLAGSLGTLGLITQVTLKALPRPAAELSLRFELAQAEALQRLNEWAGRPLPLSASAWHDRRLTLRLSGAPAALRAARERLGGEELPAPQADDFWQSVREQSHPYFTGNLWRIAVPTTASPLPLPGAPFVEWHGGLRWLRAEADPPAVRAAARAAGGHATLFRADDALKRVAGAFDDLPATLLTLHRRVKQAFDPAGIFNPGRLYRESTAGFAGRGRL
jgi:glycolate oxidase FAD binding subunit